MESGSILASAGIILGSVLCAAYLLPVVRIAYFENAGPAQVQDPGLAEKLSLVLLAVSTLVLGIFPGPFLELALRAARDLLGCC